jgi:anti-sigma factor (TIGR02949 family)
VKPECQQALQDLERFLDGELEQPRRGLLDAHLHGCTPCMERADFKRHVRTLIASRCGSQEVPAGLLDKVSSLLQSPGPREP